MGINPFNAEDAKSAEAQRELKVEREKLKVGCGAPRRSTFNSLCVSAFSALKVNAHGTEPCLYLLFAEGTKVAVEGDDLR